MKLTYMLLTSTAITSASLAYGQVISGATTAPVTIDSTDSQLTITEAGSIAVNPATSDANAVTVATGTTATIQNDGAIIITYTKEDITGTYSLSNKINGIWDTDGSSALVNNGIIQTNLTLTGGTASFSSNAYAYVRANTSGNGVYGDLESNEGIIQTNLILTGGTASASSNAYVYADAYAYAYAEDSGNGVYSDLESNEGIIQTNLTLTGGTASISSNAYSTVNASAYAHASSNGAYGDLGSNEGIIQTNLILKGGSTNTYSTTYTYAYHSSNGVHGSLGSNDGVIQTYHTSAGGSATDATRAYAYAEANASGNGVYGDLGSNEGIIQTNLILKGGTASASASSYADAYAYAYYSGNGVYGNLGTNNGTIAAYLSLTPGTVKGISATTYNFYSGNGVVLTDSSTDTAINTGSIIASNYAILATANRNVDNYGTLVGTGISGGNVTANNYGTEILIDANGNILSIDNTAAGATINGKTSEQAGLQEGDLDSYNIYISETEITDKIINGAGVANGVVTLQGTDDFTITNSSLNAYHTALDIQTTNRVDATDTYFNGGGLLGNKSIEYNATDIPVIKGDDQDNILLVHGNSYINGDVNLGDGADIFVLDIENTKLNGTADLGDADDDTFALYTFTGTGAELTTATEDYASWGMFNPYIGDKVLNFENIGAEIGIINMEDDLTAYGLYVGSQAIANFTSDVEYTLTNLRNDGLISLANGSVGGHITIGDYLKGTGIYEFDTDFATLKSDYITVNGQVTANGAIAIKDITSADGTQPVGTHEILLIEAPNDADKSDENFYLAAVQQYNALASQGRFTGSPYVWALTTSGNDWVLTTTVPGNPGPTIVAEIPAYTSLPTIGREIVMDELGTLHTRLGELRNNQGWVGTGASNLKTNLGSEWHNAIGFDDSKANAWLKGTISHFDIGSDNSFDVSGTYGGFNLGIDKKFDLGNHSPDWTVFTGLFGGYKTGEFETSGKGNQYTSNEHADIDIDAWSIGGYATFFNTAGTYIDLVAEYMDFDADIDAAGLNSSTDGYALAGSIEVGHSFDLAKDWIIEPQAQIKLAHINWDDFNDSVNDVSFEDHTYITGRAGVRIEKTIKSSIGEIKPWAYMGVLHEFSDAPEVTYANTIFEAVDYSTAGEIKLGITADVYKSTQLYSDIGYATDFNDYNSVKGDLGLRITW